MLAHFLIFSTSTTASTIQTNRPGREKGHDGPIEREEIRGCSYTGESAADTHKHRERRGQTILVQVMEQTEVNSLEYGDTHTDNEDNKEVEEMSLLEETDTPETSTFLEVYKHESKVLWFDLFVKSYACFLPMMIIIWSGVQARILPSDTVRPELSLCPPPEVTPPLLPHLPPLATPDPEIELVESQEKMRHNSGVCGHNPAKISTICLGILFMWVMLVLIMDLDKKAYHS